MWIFFWHLKPSNRQCLPGLPETLGFSEERGLQELSQPPTSTNPQGRVPLQGPQLLLEMPDPAGPSGRDCALPTMGHLPPRGRPGLASQEVFRSHPAHSASGILEGSHYPTPRTAQQGPETSPGRLLSGSPEGLVPPGSWQQQGHRVLAGFSPQCGSFCCVGGVL